uniref:Cadherin domain-containing protein n=1 Tax=Anolis carolinensis TaxID=28377 RepID=A0A803TRC8_ANOCA
MTVNVRVLDLNDNPPAFAQETYAAEVPEDLPVGALVLQLEATDPDEGSNGHVSYFLANESLGMFEVEPQTGRLTSRQRLDRERRATYSFLDVNDHARAVATLRAEDLDAGANASILYRFASPAPAFSINTYTGAIELLQPLAALNQRQRTLFILASDLGQPPRSSTGQPSLSSWATVQIQVLDLNDHGPQFLKPQYNSSVPEDLRPGTTLLTLEATDADIARDNAALDYTIVSGNSGHAFQLEGRAGGASALVLVEPLDFEAVALYNLTVAASDRGVPQRSALVPVLLGILDVNDNPPAFGRSAYHTAVSETAAPGTELLRVAAHDPDSGPHGQVHYSVSSGDPGGLFHLHPSTGALRLTEALDCEVQNQHTLVVQASDGASGHFALASVTVEVKDVNDNLPYFPLEVLTASVRENQPPGSLVTRVRAVDADVGAFGVLRYTLLPTQGWQAFALNSTSGELSARLPFDYERSKSSQLLVQATDAGNASATATVRVLVTGEDEYDPVFLRPTFSFEIPEGARRGQSIGQVMATDEDEGPDGVVLYTLTKPSPFFGVNRTSGTIYLRMDSQGPSGGAPKREPRELVLEVQAHGPLPASRSASTRVTIDVTHTAFGLATDLNLLLVVAVAASLGVVVVLAAVAIVLVLVRSRAPCGVMAALERDPGPLLPRIPLCVRAWPSSPEDPPPPIPHPLCNKRAQQTGRRGWRW